MPIPAVSSRLPSYSTPRACVQAGLGFFSAPGALGVGRNAAERGARREAGATARKRVPERMGRWGAGEMGGRRDEGKGGRGEEGKGGRGEGGKGGGYGGEMAKRDLTGHQRKIVDRYYEHRETIMVTKLGDLVSELYLAESEKARDRLWDRVEKALANVGKDRGGIDRVRVDKVLRERDVRGLAELVGALGK